MSQRRHRDEIKRIDPFFKNRITGLSGHSQAPGLVGHAKAAEPHVGWRAGEKQGAVVESD
jgi:hypothetical protein